MERQMKRRLSLAALPVACLALAGCHFDGFGGPKAPTGQVVATVEGQEITQLELQAELAGVQLPNDPKARKAVEERALQTIIARKVFAKAAKDKGLDKTPQYALQAQRATDNLLAQSLEQSLVTAVPTPNKDDASIYVANHPQSFADRKVYLVNQLRVPQGAMTQDLVKAIQPLNTIPEIISLLDTRHIPYEKGQAEIDSVVLDAKTLDAIVKLPPNTVFMIPSNNMVLINQIFDTQTKPLTGDAANSAAMQLLKRQRTQDSVKKGMGEELAKASKTIRYSAAYQPPAAKPVGAAPAPSSSGPSSSASPAKTPG
jgi:peptidyl-prolyl cis-trans isomerase C